VGSKVELTKRVIDGLTLAEGKTEDHVWDSKVPGLCVRLRRGADGGTAKAFRCFYRVGSRQRFPVLGSTEQLTPEDARRAARALFGKVAVGVDPGAESEAAKLAVTAAKNTLGRVAKMYLSANKDRWRPSTRHQNEYFLSQQWKPLHSQPVENIKRAQVAAQLRELTEKHGRASAARSRATLHAMFMWAMGEGLCEANPVVATNNPAEGIGTRERVLSDDEIKIVWNVCPPDDFGRIVKLLLLTGCRREEIGQLKWSEVDLDAGVMTISGTRIKNGRDLQLPLPSAALDILRSAKPAEGREYVFGRDGRRAGFSGWAWGKLDLDKRITEARGKAVGHWVLHDTRRTMRTGLGKIGIPPHIAELCINHVKGGVEAIYDRHTYQPQIKAALAAWAAHVDLIAKGKDPKVVPLTRSKA
jgi:integrase